MGSLLHWTQCPPDHRADREQDSTDVPGENTKCLFRQGVLPTGSHKSVSEELHTPGQPTGSCIQKARVSHTWFPGQNPGKLDGIVRAGHTGEQ